MGSFIASILISLIKSLYAPIQEWLKRRKVVKLEKTVLELKEQKLEEKAIEDAKKPIDNKLDYLDNP
jgi:hypothetical protein